MPRLSSVLRVHPLIVTLGMGAVLQGVTLLYALGPVGKVPLNFRFLAYGRIAGLPLGATIAVAALRACRPVALRYFRSDGRSMRSATMTTAAALIGLPRGRVFSSSTAFRASAARLTALYLVARFGVGQPYTGVNYTLASITPVILGGTLLSGGKGGVIGTLFGAYLISLVNNLLNFMDVSKHYQLVAQALIIILAVSVYVETAEDGMSQAVAGSTRHCEPRSARGCGGGCRAYGIYAASSLLLVLRRRDLAGLPRRQQHLQPAAAGRAARHRRRSARASS